MKAVHVLFSEGLLSRFDADPEVKNRGRSAVLRRIVAEYLERKREADIDARYSSGYAGGVGLGSEFEGWEDEAEWPKE